MSARARFILAVIVLFLLMTGPFLLTALIVWAETEGESRQILLDTLAPHLGLGTMLTALGFAAGIGVVRTLFRQYVQGLLRIDNAEDERSDVVVWHGHPYRVMAAKHWADHGYWQVWAEGFVR